MLALSLSPDGSKLAISDFGDRSIYLFDPDTPSSAKSYTLPQIGFDMGTAPTGLAVLNDGTIYFATQDTDGTGDWAFHKLDSSTSVFKDFTQLQDGGLNDNFIRVLLSSSGRVYSQIQGIVFFVEPATDVLTFASTINSNSGGNDELALSADGSTLITNGFFADANLDAVGLQVYTDREIWLPVATIGQKLSNDGTVLFQPLTDGLDVTDVLTGRLVNRVQLPFQLPTVYDSLVVDGTDDVVVAITTTGVAAIDLTAQVPTPAVRKPAKNAVTLRALAAEMPVPSKAGTALLSDRPRLKRSKNQASK